MATTVAFRSSWLLLSINVFVVLPRFIPQKEKLRKKAIHSKANGTSSFYKFFIKRLDGFHVAICRLPQHWNIIIKKERAGNKWILCRCMRSIMISLSTHSDEKSTNIIILCVYMGEYAHHKKRVLDNKHTFKDGAKESERARVCFSHLFYLLVKTQHRKIFIYRLHKLIFAVTSAHQHKYIMGEKQKRTD